MINATSDDSLVLLEDEISSLQLMAVIFYSLIICISLPGNCFLLWVVLIKVGLSSSADCLLLHLTVSDLIFTCALTPWTVYHIQGWIFGEPACKMFSWLIFLGLYSYMMFLTVMTVHRYVAVVYPLFTSSAGNRMRRYTHVSAALAWLISMGFSLPEIIHSVKDGHYCSPKYSSKSTELFGYLSQVILFFFLPFLAISVCYTRMGFVIHQSRFQSKNRHHAVCLILSIAVGFFICWAPYNVFLLYYILTSSAVDDSLKNFESPWENELVYSVTHILAYSHCCLNPLVHIFGGKKFKRFLPWTRFRHSSQSFRTQTVTLQSLKVHPPKPKRAPTRDAF